MKKIWASISGGFSQLGQGLGAFLSAKRLAIVLVVLVTLVGFTYAVILAIESPVRHTDVMH